MNKEDLQTAITSMLDGADSGRYNDELTTLLAILENTSDKNIAAAWASVHFDENSEGGLHNEEENSCAE